VQPGDAASEKDHNYQSEPADRATARTNGRGSRGGTGWFSYELPIDPSGPQALMVTYFNELGLPALLGDFDILANGTKIGHYEPNETASGFYAARYDLPPSIVAGNSKLTFKFQANGTSRIAPVCGVRVVRANAL
jgi:hypothetical protein